jgi:hypothetical protein
VFLAGCLSFVLAAGAAAVAEADAGSKPVAVDFGGPEGCSGASAFFASLRSRTDHVRRAEGAEARTTLQVRLTRERGNVTGELRIIDDRGETDTRKVQGPSCDDVVQALSLTAALALDPTALTAAAPGAPSTNAAENDEPAKPEVIPPAPSQPAPVPVAIAPTPPDSSRRPVPSFELAISPMALSVLSGSMSPGIAVAVRKNLGKSGVFRPALGLAPTYVRNDVFRSPEDAQITLLGGGATVCPLRFSASIVTVQPCALVLAGWLRATGRQVTHVATVDRSWLSAGLTVRLAAVLGRGFSVELEGGIAAPLVERSFYVTLPRNIVAKTPVISPMVSLGLAYGR